MRFFPLRTHLALFASGFSELENFFINFIMLARSAYGKNTYFVRKQKINAKGINYGERPFLGKSC
jgi:hypothetical protein